MWFHQHLFKKEFGKKETESLRWEENVPEWHWRSWTHKFYTRKQDSCFCFGHETGLILAFCSFSTCNRIKKERLVFEGLIFFQRSAWTVSKQPQLSAHVNVLWSNQSSCFSIWRFLQFSCQSWTEILHKSAKIKVKLMFFVVVSTLEGISLQISLY